MIFKKLAWLDIDEEINIRKFGIDFSKAKEVIFNKSSLSIPNIHSDYCYIGTTEDLKDVLYLYCKKEDEFIRVTMARKAADDEKNEFFKKLRGEYQ